MHAKNKKILNSHKPVIEIVRRGGAFTLQSGLKGLEYKPTSTESMQTFLVIRVLLLI